MPTVLPIMNTEPIIRPTLLFIIRLWGEPAGQDWVWRVSLRPVPAGAESHPLGFADLDAACAFLQAQMAAQTGSANND